MSLKTKKFLFYVVPLLLWMVNIFLASTDMGSEKHSGNLIRLALNLIDPGTGDRITHDTLEKLNMILRKGAHLTEYAILALLLVRAIQYGRHKLKWQSIVGAAALSLLYSISDELHQIFVPSRTSSARDVLIDNIGVTITLTVIILFFKIKHLERHILEIPEGRTQLNTETSIIT